MKHFLGKIEPASRKILYACFFAFFFNGLFSLMIGSIMPDMKMHYQLSDTTSGLMLSAHSVGNLLAGFLSGFVPLLLGRRKGIMLLCTMTSIGFAMMLLFGNPVWLVLAFIFTGIGRGSVSNFNNATVNQVSNGSPAASNLLHGFFAAGAFSAPLVFLLASSLGGWKLAVGVIIVLGISVVFSFSRIHFEQDQPDRKDRSQSSMAFVKNRSFLVFAGMMFFYLCTEYSINGWLVTYLQNKPAMLATFDVEALRVYSQSMATLLWVIILVGRLTCAALSAKIPQKKLLLAASAGVVIFFALLLLGESVTMVTVAIMGLGFCLAGICPMIYSDASYITNVYPMGTSTLLALGSIGSILMPSIVGMTADAYGFTTGMACIGAAAGLLLILAAVNLFIRPKEITATAEH